MTDDKPQQESFLAQLNEVAEVPNQCHQVVLQEVTPAFDPASSVQIPIVNTYIPSSPGPDTAQVPSSGIIVDAEDPTNGNPYSQSQSSEHDSPNKDTSSSSAPQTVTGNVKIQLMEISVDEFKANVEYIQSQFPSMQRRLICDAFSKANFDCRTAMELLTKEQEKKDQSIVPPLLLVARQQQQQQQQAQQLHQKYQQQQQQKQKSPPKVSQQSPQTPQAAQRQPASTAATPLPLPRNSRRSRLSQSPKEDPCYKRVVSGDKEAERALRQKLKSNVRSRVFSHGVKIGQGRETAASALQLRRAGPGSSQDADSSIDASIIDDEDSSNVVISRRSNAEATADVDVDADAPEPAASDSREDLVVMDASEPAGALRILRDSFPGLSEAELAECLSECDQNVDEAIRVLSGRRLESSGGGSAARFFKSKQLAGKVQQARKDYVRAELNSGAWMGRQTGAGAAAAPGSSTLRVYTVPQKRRLKREPGAQQALPAVKPAKSATAAAATASDHEDIDMSGVCDDDGNYNREQDFDSEDSDYENKHSVQSDEDKAAVLDFFNTAALSELMHIPTVSKKKAEILYKMRPFEDFDDLLNRLESHRQFNSSLVQGAREVLHMRRMVVYLMNKCEVITQKLESRVASLLDSVTLDSAGDTGGITLQPAALNPDLHLKPYQMVGLNWLRLLHEENLSAILGDQMGLGKTIQIIAFLAQLLEEGDRGPHLVIVPSSTLVNWEREIRKWCPQLQAVTYHGSMEERKAARQAIYSGETQFHVLLTTYNIATGTLEDRAMMKNLDFEYGIFDEAHMLKNCQSRRYKMLMNFRVKRRILLTGTPLQNNLVELMSLLSFVIPDVFSASRQCADLLKKMFNLFSRSATTDESSAGSAMPAAAADRTTYEMERIQHAKRLMRPFFLRRTKAQVLTQLPAKTEEVMLVPMTERQRHEYQELVASLRRRFEGAGERGSSGEVAVNYILQLRKAANHCLLHRRVYTDSLLRQMASKMLKDPGHLRANEDYIYEDLAAMNDFELHRTCQMYPVLAEHQLDEAEHLLLSGKLVALDSLLPELTAAGHRVALFSQFVMMLDIVQAYLQLRAIRFLRVDGSTPVGERQALLDRFAEDSSIPVFLLSTRAGGLGINLTAADTVIIHDIDFNPYNDKQAEDRCHRLGQERPVRVIRLLSADSVEVGVHRIACEKLRLEKDVVSDDAALGGGGGGGSGKAGSVSGNGSEAADLEEDAGDAEVGGDANGDGGGGRKRRRAAAAVKREPLVASPIKKRRRSGLTSAAEEPDDAATAAVDAETASTASATTAAAATAGSAPSGGTSLKSSEMINLLSECLGVGGQKPDDEAVEAEVSAAAAE
ncbi:hypothetical protein BOX15_Mlig005593g2 [Macrostomum lignano]|uniref:DNA helicase n=1 Tax=Macrostomum lignano TaxID=282301 RepID=A0A267EFE2_9PLAT|nr:hypothetical protein BOX15_Mlig005593g2 [Macrostomum lignano]